MGFTLESMMRFQGNVICCLVNWEGGGGDNGLCSRDFLSFCLSFSVAAEVEKVISNILNSFDAVRSKARTMYLRAVQSIVSTEEVGK